MTDIFNKIYTAVAEPLRESYPGIKITGERIPEPKQFPTVVFIEADNYVDRRYIDTTLNENITALMYEVTVFSNRASGKKSECLAILSDIDDILRRMNATRISRVDGYFDTEAKIYMVTARYNLKTDGTNLYTF